MGRAETLPLSRQPSKPGSQTNRQVCVPSDDCMRGRRPLCRDFPALVSVDQLLPQTPCCWPIESEVARRRALESTSCLATGAVVHREARGEGALDIMHGRSCMTLDPRILTLLGRSTSGFHRPRRHCLHRARIAVRCSASRMTGASFILLRTACEADLHVGDSFNELMQFPAWPLSETAMEVLCNCSLGALP